MDEWENEVPIPKIEACIKKRLPQDCGQAF